MTRAAPGRPKQAGASHETWLALVAYSSGEGLR
jgi:hypothetical protein